MTDNSKKIRQLALNYLSRRDHSPMELRQKLERKGFAKDDITVIIEALQQAGYLNESRYTENYIHYYRNRGYGPVRIKMQLQSKGIAAETIAQHIELADNIWLIAAHKVWQKHCHGKITTDLKLRAKHIRFLQYRGFTRDQIEHVFKN